MMKITILFLSLFSVLMLQAQQTFQITNWQQGISQQDASFTVNIGDSVAWTWANGAPHSVTSDAGSAEGFDSGVITESGNVFSFTFTTVGTNPYRCIVHTSMQGIITTEEILNIQDKFEKNVKLLPNPVEDDLIIASLFPLNTYEIYDFSGKKVSWGNGDGTFTNVNLNHLDSGVYFVNITSDNLRTTVKLIKK